MGFMGSKPLKAKTNHIIEEQWIIGPYFDLCPHPNLSRLNSTISYFKVLNLRVEYDICIMSQITQCFFHSYD